MLLLFWYLSLILFSGACEAVKSRSEQALAKIERHRGS
jgi:hypothetical protein